MAQVGDEQAEEQGAPDAAVGRRAQDEGFDEGEAEVQVRELAEHDRRAGRDAGFGGAAGEVGEVEVGLRLQGGVVGA